MSQKYVEPQEEQYTAWFNPLSVEQKVDIHMGDDPRPTRFRIPPGEKVRIPSRYDYAIHRVHNGVVIGGLAPQLVKLDASGVPDEDEKLDPVLDTEEQAKKQAEAEAARAALAKKAAEDEVATTAAKAAAAAAKAEAAQKAKEAQAAEAAAKAEAKAQAAQAAQAAKAAAKAEAAQKAAASKEPEASKG